MFWHPNTHAHGSAFLIIIMAELHMREFISNPTAGHLATVCALVRACACERERNGEREGRGRKRIMRSGGGHLVACSVCVCVCVRAGFYIPTKIEVFDSFVLEGDTWLVLRLHKNCSCLLKKLKDARFYLGLALSIALISLYSYS